MNTDEPIAGRFLMDELLPSAVLLFVTAIFVCFVASVSRLLPSCVRYWILKAILQ
jgi:hypothetical protein